MFCPIRRGGKIQNIELEVINFFFPIISHNLTTPHPSAAIINLDSLCCYSKLPLVKRVLTDLEIVENAYSKMGFHCLVKPFIYNMSECYGLADLVICRAGASTIAEISALGKAAIVIPFPFAANDHQLLNANFLSRTGAALTIEESNLTPEVLAGEIIGLYRNPEKLRQMEKKSRVLAKPEAAIEIVDLCHAQLQKREDKSH